METTERLWSVTDTAFATGMSRFEVQKAIDRSNVKPAFYGTTRTGGYRYRESDLVMVFGNRFVRPKKNSASCVERCIVCGIESKVEHFDVTHGLCIDCWCKELNKFLIGMKMTLEDATKATLESLKARGVI